MTEEAYYSRVQTIVLCVDVSPSMGTAAALTGAVPIDELNLAFPELLAQLREIDTEQVDLAIVTFSETVEVKQHFENVQDITAPVFKASGSGTNMSGALAEAMELIDAHRATLSANGAATLKGWVILLTDGHPNVNSAPDALPTLKQRVADNDLWMVSVAIGEDADVRFLASLGAQMEPVFVNSSSAKSIDWKQFFRFLSSSIGAGKAFQEVVAQMTKADQFDFLGN